MAVGQAFAQRSGEQRHRQHDAQGHREHEPQPVAAEKQPPHHALVFTGTDGEIAYLYHLCSPRSAEPTTKSTAKLIPFPHTAKYSAR